MANVGKHPFRCLRKKRPSPKECARAETPPHPPDLNVEMHVGSMLTKMGVFHAAGSASMNEDINIEIGGARGGS